MAFVPRKLKSVTRQLIKMGNNKPYYLKLQSAIHEGKKIGDKEPAKLIDVVDLESGEEAQIIAGAVLVGILTEAYPGGEYVGKCFEIVKFRDAGTAYNTYNVSEIADPADDEPADLIDADSDPTPEPTKAGKKK